MSQMPQNRISGGRAAQVSAQGLKMPITAFINLLGGYC